MYTYSQKESRVAGALKRRWVRFWMRYAGLNGFGRFATRLATWFALPHKASKYLTYMNPRGYVAPTATIHHSDLRTGEHILIGDRVVIYQAEHGGPIELGDQVHVLRDSIMETGLGGSLTIGSRTTINPRCQLNAYMAPIRIGQGVQLSPNCALYSYDHGVEPGKTIREQPLQTKGPIILDDDVWLGFGVIVLSGVHIGKGAAVGAGSVVTRDIPEGAIAVGRPARVIKMRSDLARESEKVSSPPDTEG
jgi:acetyltransferase-like isoleucine patch superfamily enzyme